MIEHLPKTKSNNNIKSRDSPQMNKSKESNKRMKMC